MSVAITVAKAETLSRPLSRTDCHSAIEGLSAPFAIAGMELSPLLVRTAEGMGLANGIARGQLMSMNIVAVFKGGDSVADAISVRSCCPIERLSRPLAIAGVELSPLLVRTAEGMGLANGIARGQLMSMNIVA